MTPGYAKPPIVESVLEFRFATEIPPRVRERLRDRFKKQFPAVEEQFQVEVKVLASGAEAHSTPSGFKMTAANGSDVLLIQQATLGTIRLAPYEGWDRFLQKAQENFETFTKVAGRLSISRFGTRFVNRIDLPQAVLEERGIHSFVRAGISLPPTVATAVGPYSFAVNFLEQSTGVKITLQSAVAHPSLLEHLAVVLDIDAYIDTDIPSRMDAVWALASRLHEVKNLVFEETITDEARALFSKPRALLK